MSDRRKLLNNVNGDQKFVINLKAATKQLNRMTINLMESRQDFLKSLMDPANRDLDTECGYPKDPDRRVYMEYFQRHGIARKVASAHADGTWALDPELYETADDTKETTFEKAWNDLVTRLKLWHYFHRVDVLSGIGRFGIMFLGFSGKDDLENPVRGLDDDGFQTGKKYKKPLKLNYVRALDETLVRVAEWEGDQSSPRFGQPKIYDVQFFDPTSAGEGLVSEEGTPNDFESYRVHWTRILHVADNRISSEIFGQPRMEPVINWLWDLRKVLGGSAEMFWKGAFPGFSVEAIPLAAEAGLELDEESIKTQFDAYMKGLKRYLAFVGMTVKSLAPQVADPTQHVEQLLRAISASLDIPMRVFTGSEAAHLASTQDLLSWKERLKKRQRTYIEPMIIRPFVDRMILVGILPKVKSYQIDWQDLNSSSEKDKADIALKKVQACMQYATGGVETFLPNKWFYIMIGFTPDQADAINKEVRKASQKSLTKEVWKKPEPKVMGQAGRTTKSSTKKTGKSSRNGLGSASKT